MLLRRWHAFLRAGLRCRCAGLATSSFDPLSNESFSAAAQINASLLIISVVAILLPAAFHFSVNSGNANADSNPDQDILAVSHGVSFRLQLSAFQGDADCGRC